MSSDPTPRPFSGPLFLAASVFAVAGITALVLTIFQTTPGIPRFSDLFKSRPPVAAPTDADKLAILMALSAQDEQNVSVTDKMAILKNISSSGTSSRTVTVSDEDKLKILHALEQNTR